MVNVGFSKSASISSARTNLVCSSHTTASAESDWRGNWAGDREEWGQGERREWVGREEGRRDGERRELRKGDRRGSSKREG